MLGGSPLPDWGLGVLLGGMILLVIASTFGSMFATLGRHPHPPAQSVVAGLVVAWAAAAAVLLWLSRRGWRDMQRRPHPFLVD